MIMRDSEIKTLFAKADEQVHVDEIRKQKTYHAMIDEMEKQRTPMMSTKNILFHQFWYMDKLFFAVYGVLICLGIIFITALQYTGLNQNEMITVCMVGAGILSITSISVIDKLFFGKMAELGESCYFNTKQCVAAWLVLSGMINVMILFLIAGYLNYHWRVGLLRVGLYILTPYLVSSITALGILSMETRGKNSSLFGMSAIFLSISYGVIGSIPRALFVTTLWIWAVALLVSGLLFVMQIKNGKRRSIMHELKLMDVQKKYKDKEAVRKFNYSFTNGVYGLLGENGAGKTTLMRLICGVLQPTGGSIYCDNIEIASMGAEYRRLLGYLPQDFGYYGDFTAERFLRYMAALKALPEDYADSRIDELLDMVELKNVKKKKLKTFSGGMIRRIGIAQALLNNPEILILDEPTAGLDPKERVRFRNVISSLGKNRMVLLSTHIVSDIDYIADRILIMKNGELIQEGTEKEITDKVEGCVWKCIVSEKEAGQITSSFIVSNMRSSGENVELRIVSERQPVAGAENVESTLEDAYLYHTQITGGEKNATL